MQQHSATKDQIEKILLLVGHLDALPQDSCSSTRAFPGEKDIRWAARYFFCHSHVRKDEFFTQRIPRHELYILYLGCTRAMGPRPAIEALCKYTTMDSGMK